LWQPVADCNCRLARFFQILSTPNDPYSPPHLTQ
jgi:hypothetical protein